MTQEMNVNQKAVQFLIGVACRRETTYYEALALECDLPSKGNALSMAVTKLLTEVFEWCRKKGLPPLTSLVVRKSGKFKGHHGRGFWTIVHSRGLLPQYKIEVPELGFTEADEYRVGQYLIFQTWNYFTDLRPKNNISTIHTVGDTLGDRDVRDIGVGRLMVEAHHKSATGAIMAVLESIPGWDVMSLERRAKLALGHTLQTAEDLYDQVTDLLEVSGQSVAAVWAHVLSGTDHA